MTTTASIHSIYASLDDALNRRAGASMGFDMLVGATPCAAGEAEVAAWRARYRTIKAFQERALALFKASLAGDCDPALAGMAVGDLPGSLGVAYHRGLSEQQHRTPTFFRTDEVMPGVLVEVQCPGSAWDIACLLGDLYADHRDLYGPPRVFERPLPVSLARAFASHVGADPVVHHLVDNSSRPHGMRYLIQRTREEGVRYFGYDALVRPGDCNFVRSHDFVSLRFHNFFDERMARCSDGTCRFDLPPSALFDGKLILAWPFWSRTRQYFTDEVRALFPFTSVVTPDGIEMEDGRLVSLEDLLDQPHTARNVYLKYAGTDITVNWGSRAVFLVRDASVAQRRDLAARIARDWHEGRHWIVQPAVRTRVTVDALTREGTVTRSEANAKWSACYGPDGLMAILAFHRNFHKVHGSTHTIMSLVY
jgi:hypothetical protein